MNNNNNFKNYSFYEGQNFYAHTKEKDLNTPWIAKYQVINTNTGEIVYNVGDKIRSIIELDNKTFMLNANNATKSCQENPEIAMSSKTYLWNEDIKPLVDQKKYINETLIKQTDSIQERDGFYEELKTIKSKIWAMEASNFGLFEHVKTAEDVAKYELKHDFLKEDEVYEGNKQSVRQSVDKQAKARS